MRKRKILVLSITIVALVLSLETCILRYVNEKNAQPHPMYYWIVCLRFSIKMSRVKSGL